MPNPSLCADEIRRERQRCIMLIKTTKITGLREITQWELDEIRRIFCEVIEK